MALRSSSTNSGSSATPAATVPTGVATDDIIIVVVGIDSSSAAFDSGDLPAGFTEFNETHITTDGHTAWIGWKRATGADSGSYTFGNVGASADWIAQAAAFSGRHTTDAPACSTTAVSNANNRTPITITANGVTALDNDDLIWASVPDVDTASDGNGHTAPTNYVEKQDAENVWANLSIATRENVAAGATGSIAGTFVTSTGTTDVGWAAWLARIPIAAAAAGQPTMKRGGGVAFMPHAGPGVW